MPNLEHGFNDMAYSLLLEAISDSDTTMVLPAGGAVSFLPGWQSGRTVYLTLTNIQNDIEIVKVTEIHDDILTVERGQDGSVSKAWPAGTIVTQRGVAIDFTSFIQKDGFRSIAGDPNGVLAGLYPGEKLYDTDTQSWWINITGTFWKCLAGTCTSLWTSHFDNTEWEVLSNGFWNGSAWQESGPGMALVPIGTWTDSYFPAMMRVEYSNSGFGEIRLWNVSDSGHLLCDSPNYISGEPLALDWSYAPTVPISRIDLWTTTLVTNIEFKDTI